jgi:hypothetical protein
MDTTISFFFFLKLFFTYMYKISAGLDIPFKFQGFKKKKKFWVACRRMGVNDSKKRDIFYEKE